MEGQERETGHAVFRQQYVVRIGKLKRELDTTVKEKHQLKRKFFIESAEHMQEFGHQKLTDNIHMAATKQIHREAMNAKQQELDQANRKIFVFERVAGSGISYQPPSPPAQSPRRSPLQVSPPKSHDMSNIPEAEEDVLMTPLRSQRTNESGSTPETHNSRRSVSKHLSDSPDDSDTGMRGGAGIRIATYEGSVGQPMNLSQPPSPARPMLQPTSSERPNALPRRKASIRQSGSTASRGQVKYKKPDFPDVVIEDVPRKPKDWFGGEKVVGGSLSDKIESIKSCMGSRKESVISSVHKEDPDLIIRSLHRSRCSRSPTESDIQKAVVHQYIFSWKHVPNIGYYPSSEPDVSKTGRLRSRCLGDRTHYSIIPKR